MLQWFLGTIERWRSEGELKLLCCSFSAGFVCLGLGAVPLQRGQHDRLQTAKRWWPLGCRHNGQVGHGKAAGSQTREWPDGWNNDCKCCSVILYCRALTIRTSALLKASNLLTCELLKSNNSGEKNLKAIILSYICSILASLFYIMFTFQYQYLPGINIGVSSYRVFICISLLWFRYNMTFTCV